MADERVVEKVLELGASVERVWRAITNADELSRWFPHEARFDASPGYEGAFIWREHGSFAVRVDEAVPPTRLVWSWVHETGVPFADGGVATTVVWTLTPRPDGGTTLHLRESGFPSDKRREENDGGWDAELAELVELVTA